MTAESQAALERYAWPGNVRELKNLLEQLVVLGPTDGVIRPENLPPKLHGRMAGDGASGWSTPPWDFDGRGIDFYREMESIEDRIIARALDISRGNKKEAARLLQLNRTTLLEKLKRKRETRALQSVGEEAERLGPLPMAAEASHLGELVGLAGGQALRA